MDIVNSSPSVARFEQIEDGPGKKRARTRAAIVDAAIRIFARDGVGAASILEITKEADISNGTFYFYFKNKDELVHSVGEMLIVHVLDELHSVIDTSIQDPSEKVAFGIQWVVDKAAHDPELGSLLAQSMVTDGPYSLEVHARFRIDVRAGIALGQFHVDDVDLVCLLIAAVDAAAIRSVLDGADLEEVKRVVAEQHLRMVGVEHGRARVLVEQARERLDSGTSLER